MSNRQLAVVSAGLNVPSSTRLLADRLVAATVEALQGREVDTEVDVIELRNHAHDLVDNVLTGFPSQNLRVALDRVVSADGLIAVTPIFSTSYNGLFKMFVDVLDDKSLVGMPTLIAATAGTARHSLALEHAVRPLFTYLRAVVVPTAVFGAPEDWAGGDETSESLAERIERAAGELAELVAARETPKPADPFSEPTPFEDLLNRHQS